MWLWNNFIGVKHGVNVGMTWYDYSIHAESVGFERHAVPLRPGQCTVMNGVRVGEIEG